MIPALDEYGQHVLHISLVLGAASIYAMGMMEGRKGRVLLALGILVHVISIIHRGILLGAMPVSEKHDTISWMALSMAGAHWYYTGRDRLQDVNLSSIPMIVLVLLVSLGFQPINTISPFMHSPWFYLHTLLYCTSYGYMGIAASIGLHSFLSHRPELEMTAYRAGVAGWIVLSLSLCAGSIWFYMAYGTYWLWTSREMWISILWLYWSLYLHARLIRGMAGIPARVMGLAGFAVALFAYFGVGTIIPSPPTDF